MGFLGSLASSFRGVIGGEVPQVTKVIEDGRRLAFSRMMEEVQREHADGVVGVTSDLRSFAGNTEFLFVGSSVQRQGHVGAPFACAGDAQELFCHMDAGFQPLGHAFGNIAYSIGAVGGVIGTLKTLGRGEIREFSDIFNRTRHDALARLEEDARTYGANAVVGVRVNVSRFLGMHEMFLVGTAARHAALSGAMVSSDLTGEEAWAMASLGFAPVRMLISSSVYSLGLVGSLKAMFKAFVRGEISDLTTMIYDAREQVFGRLHAEAAALGADQVLGIKTHIVELGSGLVEFLAVGTAVRRVEGMATATDALPAQAIIRDRDTWLEGYGGFDVQSERAGG
jgi:uncharacterized protein YbjQ (UPF0145 family)